MAGTSSPPASVDLPIWFPEDRIGNTTVARFWAAFEKDAWNALSDRPCLGGL